MTMALHDSSIQMIAVWAHGVGVLIEGLSRRNCVHAAGGSLSPGGVLLRVKPVRSRGALCRGTPHGAEIPLGPAHGLRPFRDTPR